MTNDAGADTPHDEDTAQLEEGGAGFEEQRRRRAAKIDALRSAGVNPYPDRFDRSATSAELHEAHPELEDGGETEITEQVAGRIMLSRNMGKLMFVTLRDVAGTIQLFISKGVVGADDFDRIADLDLGDWVGASGTVIRTRTGELSIKATEVNLLAKAVRPLPSKWHGLSDVDTRFRQRYVDLIVNDDARRVFDIRHTVVATIRRVLMAHNYVEVETPVLQIEAGGAAARPFTTHHNALDQPMYLRIATELHLKRLVVGGMERVFEIGRIFRNEGIDTRHNPEFTSVELYQALADQFDMMNLAEELIAESAQAALGTTVIAHPDGDIDLTPPWPREKMADLIKKFTSKEVDPRLPVAEMRSICDELDVAYEDHWGSGRLMFEIFDERVEAQLEGPVFVREYPSEVSPLSRRNAEVPEYSDRFELYVKRRELANAFSELNDPVLQRQAFEDEVSLAEAGDEEAQRTVDEDYLRALEFGLPPTGGMGIGIDRLVMLLAGVDAIREVILFPTLRPESVGNNDDQIDTD